MPDSKQGLLAQLFVMLTVRPEDTHELAAAGQGPSVKPKHLMSLARQLREIARDIISFAEVIMILVDRPAH